jgi:hypothetical protein
MEEYFYISSPIDGLNLFLRYLPARVASPVKSKVVLFVHGGTFPSAYRPFIARQA